MLFIVDKDSDNKELRKIYKYLRKMGKVNWKYKNQFHFPKTSKRLEKHMEFTARRIGQCICLYTGYNQLSWTSHHFGSNRWFFEVIKKDTQDV